MNEDMPAAEPPLVSVLVPVYNAERYLGRCIESVLAQTYGRVELVMVDDGSTDGSAAIVDDYAVRHAGRMVVEHRDNRGAATARNRAIELAAGDYLMFLDDDDYLDVDCVEAYVAVLADGPCDVVCGGYRRPDAAGVVRQCVTPVPGDEWAPYLVVAAWAKLFRTSFVRERCLSFLATNIGEDACFTLPAVACASTLRVTPYCGYNWFVNPDSVSNTSQRRSEGLSFEPTLDVLVDELDARGVAWDACLRHYLVRYVAWFVLYTCAQDGWVRARGNLARYRGWLDRRVPGWEGDPLASPRRPRGDLPAARMATWLLVRRPRLFRLALRLRCLAAG